MSYLVIYKLKHLAFYSYRYTQPQASFIIFKVKYVIKDLI